MLLILAVILSNLGLANYYVHINEAPERQKLPKNSPFSPPYVPYWVMMAFIVMFNEGAVEHWSNLFLFSM